ncbi:MAG: hypothetical protein HFH08_06360 [Bacilli bacterium]|nr:hypothetical protein [Bacilli bacterium]
MKLYIRKKKIKFITYFEEKYKIEFQTIDEYLSWLYKDFVIFDKMKYYQILEKDMITFFNIKMIKTKSDKKFIINFI